jgi:hypothetical protein
VRAPTGSVKKTILPSVPHSHAEISDFDVTRRIQENVLRFEITMADVEPVAII